MISLPLKGTTQIRFPVSKPDLTGNEQAYLNECIRTNWISSKGPFVKKLENEWAKFCNKNHAIACSSGTTALTLAIAALRIGEGDNVIVPDFTMVATANAVAHNGARPIFVDCDVDLNIDSQKIEEAITPRTKAILAVHIYGRPCDMKTIMDIAQRYNLWVIEDVCEAHGITTRGHIQCYSLFANKIISAGEGGLITTNDERLSWQMRHLCSLAFDDEHSFFHEKPGFNFRMTNLQAAVALAQLERIKEFLEKRKKICEWYDKKLKQLTIKRPDNSVLWMYDVILPDNPNVESRRKKIMDYLKTKGIETRFFFKPMSSMPMFRDTTTKEGLAYNFAKRGFYLPTYTQLTEEDVDYISEQLLTALKMC